MRYDLYQSHFLTRQRDAERTAEREQLADNVRPRLSERVGQALIAAGERLTEEKSNGQPSASLASG
jgi:hypothetical protein